MIQAALFGVWHAISVTVWPVDGTIGIPAALTGTLWAGLFEHYRDFAGQGAGEGSTAAQTGLKDKH